MVSKLFKNNKSVIGVVHLDPLPGSPGYEGNITLIKNKAYEQAVMFQDYGLSGIIFENFGDFPFFKETVPAQTIASMTSVISYISKDLDIPFGVNVLRNDADAALAIGHATDASFIRVNVHSHAVMTDQGWIEGRAAQTLRSRKNLGSNIQIWADVRVKHAAPIVDMPLADEVRDLEQRSLTDALIVTGGHTGGHAELSDLGAVKDTATNPVYVGSGVRTENLSEYYDLADGFIVGSAFKIDGHAKNDLEADRIKSFMTEFRSLSDKNTRKAG